MSEENVSQVTETVGAQEKLITQSELNGIVAAVKRETAAKTRAQLESERKVYEEPTPAINQDYLESRIEKGIDERFNNLLGEMSKKEADRVAHEQITTFERKLGTDPFSEEVKSILNDPEYDSRQLVSVIPVLTEMDNTREVFDHLMMHPAQLALLQQCAQQSKKAAFNEATRLSNAIKQNNKKAETPAKEPIPKINNFNAGSSSSDIVNPSQSSMSVSDFQKYLSSRRR